MSDDAQSPSHEPIGSNLDFDRIKAEIDSLDSEIREDTSERLGAHAVIQALDASEVRLSEILRTWRLQPTDVTFESLGVVQRLLPAIYEILEDDLPRFPDLWSAYRKLREGVEGRYGRAMDMLSVFGEVLAIYRGQDHWGRPLDQVGSDAVALSANRRAMIEAVRDYSEVIKSVVKRLAARASASEA